MSKLLLFYSCFESSAFKFCLSRLRIGFFATLRPDGLFTFGDDDLETLFDVSLF